MSNGRILSFKRSSDGGRFPVTQHDLELFLSASRELEAAQEAFREIYGELRFALLAGAEVEPGTHEAYMITCLSTGRIVPQFRYKKLFVR